jgi:hypothetical protein
MTYTLSVKPSRRSPRKVTATSSDSHTLTTSMPLLDGVATGKRSAHPQPLAS